MSSDIPADEGPPEPENTETPVSQSEDRRKPRARWKLLLFLGAVGVVAVAAEFLIPRMLMMAEVAKQAEEASRRTLPPVIPEENLPWTTQTVEILQPAGETPVAVLSRAERPVTSGMNPNAQSLLAHEVARQALLFGLRENLGLSTCDEALGVSAPPGKRLGRITMRTVIHQGNRMFSVTFERDGEKLLSKKYKLKNHGPDHPPFRQPILQVPANFLGYAVPYEDLARQTLKEAQGPWMEAFGSLDLKTRPVSVDRNEEKPLDRSITDSLETWTFTEPFDAVQRLHAEVESKGLSPARLSGLSFGYAQLGYLSAHLWTSIHEPLSARGLIYAQRRIELEPNASESYWNRAYVLALTGLHERALDDLATADRLRQARPEADRPEPPKWVETLNAFCRFDDEHLDRIARTGSAFERTRARVLGAWAQFDPMLKQDHASVAAQAAIKAEPECYRLYSDYYDTSNDLGDGHKATGMPLAIFSVKVPSRLKDMRSLPESVRSVLEAESDEMAVVHAIEKAAAAESARTELPWSVLARWMREERFLQVLHRTEFMFKRWNVPIETFLQEYGPLVRDHPFLFAIESIYQQPDSRTYDQFHVDDPEAREAQAIMMLMRVRGPKYRDPFERMYSSFDDTYDQYMSMPWVKSKSGELVAGIRLQLVSPHAPLGPASMIKSQDITPAQAEEWLVSHVNHPMVVSQLGLYFESRGDRENARKAYELVIKNAHDSLAYEKLAAIHRAEGRNDEWKRLLDEELRTTPDRGLRHAKIQVEIANDLMARGRPEDARPYADAAAETWAAWAMLCAVGCHEMLQEWDTADLWMSRLSERYPNHALEWYFWCMRNEHGNVIDARTLAMDAVGAMDLAQTPDSARSNALFACVLAHEYRKAIEILEVDFPQPKLYLQGLYLGLCGDEVDDPDVRKRGWTEIPEGDPNVSGLANLFLEAVARDDHGDLDLQAVNALLKEAPAKRQADLGYFVGRFLQRRGRFEDAALYLEQARSNPSALDGIRTAASAALREGK